MTVDCVFDTSALCAYHLGEPGGDVVGQFLKNRIKVMHSVNMAGCPAKTSVYSRGGLWNNPLTPTLSPLRGAREFGGMRPRRARAAYFSGV